MILLMLPQTTQAQKGEKKFTKMLCDCTNKINMQNEPEQMKEQMDLCTQLAAVGAKNDINNDFKKQREHKHLAEYIQAMVINAALQCPSFMQLVTTISAAEDTTTDLTGKTHINADECNMVHTGTFHQYYLGDTIFISRQGNEQYEGILGSNTYLYSKIVWVDACTYQTSLIETNDPNAKKMLSNDSNITVYITQVNGNIHSYFTTINGMKLSADLTKVSDTFYIPKK